MIQLNKKSDNRLSAALKIKGPETEVAEAKIAKSNIAITAGKFYRLLTVLFFAIAANVFAPSTTFAEDFINSSVRQDAIDYSQHQKIAGLFSPNILSKQSKASSAAEAANIARRQHGGKVLSVDTKKSGKNVVYRVKILLDSGRVKTVTIPG